MKIAKIRYNPEFQKFPTFFVYSGGLMNTIATSLDGDLFLKNVIKNQ